MVTRSHIVSLIFGQGACSVMCRGAFTRADVCALPPQRPLQILPTFTPMPTNSPENPQGTRQPQLCLRSFLFLGAPRQRGAQVVMFGFQPPQPMVLLCPH